MSKIASIEAIERVCSLPSLDIIFDLPCGFLRRLVPSSSGWHIQHLQLYRDYYLEKVVSCRSVSQRVDINHTGSHLSVQHHPPTILGTRENGAQIYLHKILTYYFTITQRTAFLLLYSFTGQLQVTRHSPFFKAELTLLESHLSHQVLSGHRIFIGLTIASGSSKGVQLELDE